MRDTEDLFEKLTAPSNRLINDIKKIKGDIIIVGAGGKIGPTLAVLAKKASVEAGGDRRIIAASVFPYKDTITYMQENELKQ